MNTYLTLHNKTQFYSKYLKEDIYNLLDYTFEIPDEFTFDVIKLNPNYIARPDLLSYDLYGTDEYADIICKINGISNPFEMNGDDVIVVPSITNIPYFNVKPTILETDNENNRYNKPKPKQKNEKRKPNESIIGDKRFTIDLKNRVVIY